MMTRIIKAEVCYLPMTNSELGNKIFALSCDQNTEFNNITMPVKKRRRLRAGHCTFRLGKSAVIFNLKTRIQKSLNVLTNSLLTHKIS